MLRLGERDSAFCRCTYIASCVISIKIRRRRKKIKFYIYRPKKFRLKRCNVFVEISSETLQRFKNENALLFLHVQKSVIYGVKKL